MLIENLKKINNIANINWVFTIVTDSAIQQLHDLNQALSGSPKIIPSGYAYWTPALSAIWIGIGRRNYNYSNRLTETRVVENLSFYSQNNSISQDKDIVFVSLGVGDGVSDIKIINQFNFSKNSKCIYIPLDMSKDFLLHTIEKIKKDVRLSKKISCIIPIEVDFSKYDNLQKIRQIVDKIGENKTIIFSLVGNTFANFENHEEFLNLLCENLIKFGDYFLLGVSTVDIIDKNSVKEAEKEYNDNESFKKFAKSSLSVLTSLEPRTANIVAEAIKNVNFIEIKTSYIHNENSRTFYVTGTNLGGAANLIKIQHKEKIKLYLSRKFKIKYISNILERFEFEKFFEKTEHKDPESYNKIGSSLFFYRRKIIQQIAERQNIVVVIATANLSEAYLKTDEEARNMIRIFDYMRINYIFLPAVTCDDLIRTLANLTNKSIIFHFIGHGSQLNGLAFKNSDEFNPNPEMVTGKRLKNIFKGKNIRLAILNSCYSDTIAREIQGTVKVVIGTEFQFNNSSSIDFSEIFYENLFSSMKIKYAFDQSKQENQILRFNSIGDLNLPIF